MATFIPLADAIVAMLNGHTFTSAQFPPAERIYDALRNLEELENLRVDVLLGDKKQEPIDRTRMQNHPRIEIAVRRVIKAEAGSKEEKAQLDGLVAFVEEIDDFLSMHDNRRPLGAPWAAWQGSELVYPFLPLQLRRRQFTSLLRMTYFVCTDPATP